MKKLFILVALTTVFAFDTQASCPTDPEAKAQLFKDGVVYLMKAEVHSAAINPETDLPHYENFLKMRDCAAYDEETGRAPLSAPDRDLLREKIVAYLNGDNQWSVTILVKDYPHLVASYGTQETMIERLVELGDDPVESWSMFQHGIFYPESLE